MTAEARTPVLETRGLTRDYGELQALSPLDLSVAGGEMVALVGPNGAGKSTLLALAAGLLEPTDGSVSVERAAAGSLEARAATAFLPDTPVLYEDLSLQEHLEYVARLHGEEDWSGRAADLLGQLALTARGGDLPSTFSRGMRQKSAIAIAFIRPFRLLLADEPFDGLDPNSRQILSALFGMAVAGGAAVIVSTHRLDVVEQADRCLALFDGELAYDGPADPGRLPIAI